MKIIKIRSIEEAKALTLPPFPRSLLDEAHQLQLKTERSNMSRHSILKEIYALADKGSAVVEPLTVCSKGCAACCEITVGVTELEASYIERNTGRRMAVGVATGIPNKVTTRCPFLSDDDICSIYAFRPFACRTYAAFDSPALCAELETSHVTYNSNSNNLFVGSRKWIFELNGRGAVADIRTFFGNGSARKISL